MKSQNRIGIIGGGIAGMSAAYFLSQRLGGENLVLIEAEDQLTHHTTGRSAAVLIENYGEVPVRGLTKAGLNFLKQPPEDLVDGPIISRRGSLFVGTPNEDDEIQRLIAEAEAVGVDQEEISMEAANKLCPFLRPGIHSRALYEPQASDIDVAGLHQAFLRGFRRAGGTIITSTRIDDIAKISTGWRLGSLIRPGTLSTQGSTTFQVDLVVNAAGAWGDVVAPAAGITPLGLEPKRRTAFMIKSSFPGSANWPIVSNAEHTWYVKPDGSQFMCSPADETPSEPCDAKPEELDIALAIDRINAATTLDIRSISSQWAGLRTFAPDRSLVIGPDPADSTFVWIVGQGGIGIQTSPGAGQLLADLVVDGNPGVAFEGLNLDLAGLVPDRITG